MEVRGPLLSICSLFWQVRLLADFVTNPGTAALADNPAQTEALKLGLSS